MTAANAGVYCLEARNLFGTGKSREISVVIGTNEGEAMDLEAVPWDVGHQQRPLGQNEFSWDGEDALQFEGNDAISTELEGPANYSFWWRKEREGSEFICYLEQDDRTRRVANLIEAGEWVEQRIHIPSGQHQVTWASDTDEGSRMWLDYLAVTEAPAFVSPPSQVAMAADGKIEVEMRAAGSGELEYQWFENGIEIAGAQDETLSVEGVEDIEALSYELRVRSEQCLPVRCCDSQRPYGWASSIIGQQRCLFQWQHAQVS